MTDTCDRRPPRDTLSTLPSSSSSTTAESPLPLPRLVNPSEMRLPRDRVFCEFGELQSGVRSRLQLIFSEFTMAEIEHYVDPLDKKHTRFNEVKDVKLMLLPKDVQMDGRTDLRQMTVGDAVAQGIVDNETLGYFLARTQLFLTKIGIDPTRLRCRQHMANEMAHYAAVSKSRPLMRSQLTIRTAGTLRSNRLTAGSSVSDAPTDPLTTLPSTLSEPSNLCGFSKPWTSPEPSRSSRLSPTPRRLVSNSRRMPPRSERLLLAWTRRDSSVSRTSWRRSTSMTVQQHHQSL